MQFLYLIVAFGFANANYYAENNYTEAYKLFAYPTWLGTTYPDVINASKTGLSHFFCKIVEPGLATASDFIFLDARHRYLPSTVLNESLARLTLTSQNVQGQIRCVLPDSIDGYTPMGSVQFNNPWSPIGETYPRVLLTTFDGRTFIYCQSFTEDIDARNMVFYTKSKEYLPSLTVTENIVRARVENRKKPEPIFCLDRRNLTRVIGASYFDFHLPFITKAGSGREWNATVDRRVSIDGCDLTYFKFSCVLYWQNGQEVKVTMMIRENFIILNRFHSSEWFETGAYLEVLASEFPYSMKIVQSARTILITTQVKAPDSQWFNQIFYYDIATKKTSVIVG